MNFYLPTREECQHIIKKSEAFYVAERVVEGQNVEIYDYRLASISDFFPEGGDNWTELRGLTFVQQENGTWERNILMQKFFNVNQTIGWMYDDVKNKKITRVQNKEDGSIISFVKFANGKVRAKSKMSFESEQAVMAQEVYDNDENLQKMVKTMIDQNLPIIPIFELVSPENQIVLEYQKTELRLLQVRNAEYGTYSDTEEVALSWNVPYAEEFPESMKNLDDLLARKELDQSNIEGWVVTFNDGQMAKIKTDKYLSLHGLIGPDAFRENLLVKTILDGNIDDVISSLVPGNKKDKIIEVTEKVTHHFNHLVVEFKELRRKYFQDFEEDRKTFALKYRNEELFSGVMKTLNTSFKDVEKTAEDQVKMFIEKQCNSLGDAKKYLEELK